jgi:hypothetical protein
LPKKWDGQNYASEIRRKGKKSRSIQTREKKCKDESYRKRRREDYGSNVVVREEGRGGGGMEPSAIVFTQLTITWGSICTRTVHSRIKAER